MEEVWSSSEAEKDPVDDSEGEEEEEEEEEDPGSSDDYGSGEEEEDEDEDSLPASAHRPVTRSTPKKPVSRPKRKAYRSKESGPGGSSRKWSKGQRKE